MSEYAEIQNAFLDGFEEIYSLMFSNKIGLSLLDEDATETNIYDESPGKRYRSPINLVGRITTSFEQGENPIEGVQIDAVIWIPTKQLMTKQIPHESEEDLETLKKAKLSYGGFDYLVDKVVPHTFVADKWQLYVFYCHVDKKTSL